MSSRHFTQIKLILIYSRSWNTIKKINHLCLNFRCMPYPLNDCNYILWNNNSKFNPTINLSTDYYCYEFENFKELKSKNYL